MITALAVVAGFVVGLCLVAVGFAVAVVLLSDWGGWEK